MDGCLEMQSLDSGKMVSSINQILHKRHFVGVAKVLLLEVLLQLALSLR